VEKLIDLLKEINNQIDYEKEQNLITDSLFSSFDILQCISLIEDYYDLEIPANEIQNENFSSAQKIFEMINRIKKHTRDL
jgi:acyl carrier protein